MSENELLRIEVGLLRKEVKTLASNLLAVSEVLGLFYEEKYGPKKNLLEIVKDLEREGK